MVVTIFGTIIRDIDEIVTVTCDGNYFFNGYMDVSFSGYVPQIGDSYEIIHGASGSCPSSSSFSNSSSGFDTILTMQCQSNALSCDVIDINYTTAISWDGEGIDNFWNTPENWDPNGIPPAGSDIIINLPGDEGGYVITRSAGVRDAHTIRIGRHNTLEINTDLLMDKFIYIAKDADFNWNKGKIYSKDENEQSAMINYGGLTLSGSGLKELDTNFYIWNYFEDINHNGGDLNINNGIIRMFGHNSYNINSDNITIGYNSGTLHELTISAISKLVKTGAGTSSIDLTTFVNYGDVISEFGTLEINGNLTTGEYLDVYGSYGGSGNIKFPSSFVMDGNIAPGSSPGILTVVGDFETSSSATFEIEIDGPNVGAQYDQIIVGNDAVLEGDIEVILGYLPANDASFEIVTAGTLVSCDFPTQISTDFNGTSYTFDVSCQNNILYLNGPGATLSNSNNTITNLEIYPNPVGQNLNISAPNLSQGSWALINQIGQVIKQGNYKSKTFNVSVTDLPSGFYFIKLEDVDFNTTAIKKIIVDN